MLLLLSIHAPPPPREHWSTNMTCLVDTYLIIVRNMTALAMRWFAVLGGLFCHKEASYSVRKAVFDSAAAAVMPKGGLAAIKSR